jgi:hypothetical protein
VKPLMSMRVLVIESLLPNRVRVLSNLEERRRSHKCGQHHLYAAAAGNPMPMTFSRR